MTRRQLYFVKQKLIGLGMIIMGIVLSLIASDMSIINLFTITFGLWFIFTKQMVWMDDYYNKIEERKERRGRL